MLFEIRELLIERQQMSLADLARHFYVSEELLLGMIEHWQKKGRIETVDASGYCGTECGTCDESEGTKLYYRWKTIAEKPIATKIEN